MTQLIDDYNRQQLPRQALAFILAGGRGTRLMHLTEHHAKPAIFFGGKFRIIDFSLSNCLNSGIRRIGVLTQYKSHSLLQHLQRGWSFLRPEANEFVDLLPAQQRFNTQSWYQGTADAVYQNLDLLKSQNPQYVVILAGDHIYKMDYAKMLADHVRQGFPCTIGCIHVPLSESEHFGIMEIDSHYKITRFLEKPKPATLKTKAPHCLASMGVYIFNRDYLCQILEADAERKTSQHDFGHDVIPEIVAKGEAYAHSFEHSCVRSSPEAELYWKDVGTIDSYFQANIDLTSVIPSLDLYDQTWPILTFQPQLPPVKFVFDQDTRRGQAFDSVISNGAIISGSTLRRCLVSPHVRVNSYSYLEECILLPNVTVGRHTRLKRVIAEPGCRIPEGMVIGEYPVQDEKIFYRTPKGVVLVTQNMLDQWKK